MSYPVTAANVMIASPGDVLKYRLRAREIVTEWNFVHSKFSKIVLQPVGWETHVSPDLSGPPQKIINEKILADSDILIGIFWTRIGTQTLDSVSGSAEEIEKHISLGKPAMVYFSKEPVAPGSYDETQYKSLLEFKKWCMSKGIIEEFDDIGEFSDKLRNHLAMKVNESVAAGVLLPPTGTASTSASILSVTPDTNNAELLSLTIEAKILLKNAAQDRSGTIMKLSFIGGRHIETNGKQFGAEDQRSFAKWNYAIEQLVEFGLLAERGSKGEMFEVTAQGYDLADKLPDN